MLRKINIFLTSFLLSLLFIFFSVSYTDAQTCQLSPQRAYTSPDSSAVYYITKDCTKRPFKNPDVFFSYFDSWSQVKATNQSILNAISKDGLGFMPWGPKKNFRSGVLVKTVDDPKTYILLKDQKCWIESETVFNELNYKWSWVTDVDPRLLDRYETCDSPIDYTDHHPVGTLIKYPDSKDVYILKEHPNKEGEIVKKIIEDQQEFNQLGYRWDRIITIEKSEQYTSWSDLSQEAKQNSQNSGKLSSTKFQLQDSSIVARGDGTYTLREGDAVVADNQVAVKLEKIRELSLEQQQEFGSDKYWLKFSFYANGSKITLKPIRFSGVYRAQNSNKLYDLDVGYEASKRDIKNGVPEVEISLNSLSSKKVNSCKDLVEMCKQKDREADFCKRKYCPTEPLKNENKFQDGQYTAIIPDKLNEIGDKVLAQMKTCHNQVKDKLEVDSSLDRAVVRFVYGSGSAKTTDVGIVWPVEKAEIQKEIEKWNKRGENSCQSNLMAHELTHHFARGISMDDIFHEGVANLTAQKVSPDPSSNISCKQKGWSGNTPQSHASQSQLQCYKNCLPSCYKSAELKTITEGGSYAINDRKLIIEDIKPKKYWPNTDKTGSYHGTVEFRIEDSGEIEDSGTLFIGDIYDDNGLHFIPDGILIKKVVYPNRTEKTNKIRMRFYSNTRANAPKYCSNSCKSICQRRISENTIEYNNIDNYLDLPWKPTFKMFYNTSQCLFEKGESGDTDLTKNIVQAGKQKQEKAEEFCVGQEIQQRVPQSTYDELQNTFDLRNECVWEIQRIANIDCWNKSCRPGKRIR